MAFDTHLNFAYTTVTNNPGTAGTTITVQSGTGTRFAAPANLVVCPFGQLPTPANAEIVRLTVVSTDTFTVTRTQEGSTARNIQAGDQVFLAVTAKTLTDVENTFGTSVNSSYTSTYLTATGTAALAQVSKLIVDDYAKLTVVADSAVTGVAVTTIWNGGIFKVKDAALNQIAVLGSYSNTSMADTSGALLLSGDASVSNSLQLSGPVFGSIVFYDRDMSGVRALITCNASAGNFVFYSSNSVTKGVVMAAGKLGVEAYDFYPIQVPYNSLDVGCGGNAAHAKGAAIGSTYAYTYAAPNDGLLVEGAVVIGTTTQVVSPATMALTVAGHTYVQGTLYLKPAATAYMNASGLYFYDAGNVTTATFGSDRNVSTTLPVVKIASIWNYTGTFTGLLFSMTDTSSNAGSLFWDAQTGVAGTTSVASLRKSGTIVVTGIAKGVATKTAGYTLTDSDHTILLNGTTLTATLPTIASVPTGRIYTVKLIASSTGTVSGNGVNIDGATTYTLSAQYKYVTVQSNGTQWYIIANN